jgi:hypothetical protein
VLRQECCGPCHLILALGPRQPDECNLNDSTEVLERHLQAAALDANLLPKMGCRGPRAGGFRSSGGGTNEATTLTPSTSLPTGRSAIAVPSARLARLAWIAGGAVLFFWLALDWRLHQDEPSYLYIGAFLPLDAILAGDFQPSGIEGHYMSRLLHVLLVHALTRVTGPGMLALTLTIAIYLVLLLASAWLTILVLAELMPGAARLGTAVLLMAFTPVYLFLAFKTLPETPAFFFSSLAALALLRSLHGRAALWLSVSCCSLVAVAFFKNNMALLWISLVGALLLVPPVPLSRMRLVGHAVIAGGGALVLSLISLFLADIELARYVGVGAMALAKHEPFVVTLLNVGLEGGAFFIALPLALLSRQRRSTLFFATWFVLSSAPLFLIFSYVEFRYLATNLIALTGLIWLAAEALRPRLIHRWEQRRPSLLCFGAASVFAVAGSNALALAIMMHEVRMDHLADVVERLDRAYGPDYAILVPWTFTNFHYLRFVYPDRQIYSVQSVFEDYRSAVWWRQMQDRYYGKQVIRSMDELTTFGSKLVYLGYDENFSVANLRTVVSFVPFLGLERQFQKARFINHLAMSWMWEDPNVILTERFRRGYYRVYDVKLRARVR